MSKKVPLETYDPRARAAEKAAAREADVRALASGEKTREQLRAENGAFSFPPERVRVDFSGARIMRTLRRWMRHHRR